MIGLLLYLLESSLHPWVPGRLDTHPKKISPLTVDFRPPNYLESLISPIVESIETFLNAEREGGGRRAAWQWQAAGSGPTTPEWAGKIGNPGGGREGSSKVATGVDEGEDDESRFDKGRLIGAEIMN